MQTARVTEYELGVLRATADGDPWSGLSGAAALSRGPSQAVRRLEKKGLVEKTGDGGWRVTAVGRGVLK